MTRAAPGLIEPPWPGVLRFMIQFLLNSLLYFPSRHIALQPDAVGLPFTDVHIQTEDGERLHAWWFPARPRSVGHILLFHGNAGNIGDRLLHAQLLTGAGFDVLLFDYRGYGRSTGKPEEEGIYRDARAAGSALVRREGVDPGRVFYLGESLGGAVALALAREVPPRGLILVSTFTSVREMGRLHYPVLPSALVPDAFPNLTRIRDLECPLLLMHGDRDDIVPIDQGQALFEAAPGPKRRHVFEGLGHNDILVQAGAEWTEAIAGWVGSVLLGLSGASVPPPKSCVQPPCVGPPGLGGHPGCGPPSFEETAGSSPGPPRRAPSTHRLPCLLDSGDTPRVGAPRRSRRSGYTGAARAPRVPVQCPTSSSSVPITPASRSKRS